VSDQTADARALTVSGVDSGYGEAQVLDDLSLHLNEGEIVCIIGPNGAGKSTVLKTVFGLLKPWTGTVELGGRDITGMAPEELVRAGVGYVPQVDNVFGSLSIEENLRMGSKRRSRSCTTASPSSPRNGLRRPVRSRGGSGRCSRSPGRS
jgi:branched-chain amino acid transport system ATP-binding protein